MKKLISRTSASILADCLLLLLLGTQLQGCIFVAGAAAGAATAAIAYDHQKMGRLLQDQKAANNAIDALNAVPGLRRNSHINVTVFNHIALLTGQAVTSNYKAWAEQAVRNARGIDKVYNQIAVQGPSSPLTRTSDAWITAKIKSEMVASKGLKSGLVKVVTEDGVVYLMGIVTQDQADKAVEIARQVSGVQRVVKIFQYPESPITS